MILLHLRGRVRSCLILDYNEFETPMGSEVEDYPTCKVCRYNCFWLRKMCSNLSLQSNCNDSGAVPTATRTATTATWWCTRSPAWWSVWPPSWTSTARRRTSGLDSDQRASMLCLSFNVKGLLTYSSVFFLKSLINMFLVSIDLSKKAFVKFLPKKKLGQRQLPFKQRCCPPLQSPR